MKLRHPSLQANHPFAGFYSLSPSRGTISAED
ncbi:hypothetical protein MY11210_009113 [Beauveria gryllotalpidicola]